MLRKVEVNPHDGEEKNKQKHLDWDMTGQSRLQELWKSCILDLEKILLTKSFFEDCNSVSFQFGINKVESNLIFCLLSPIKTVPPTANS